MNEMRFSTPFVMLPILIGWCRNMLFQLSVTEGLMIRCFFLLLLISIYSQAGQQKETMALDRDRCVYTAQCTQCTATCIMQFDVLQNGVALHFCAIPHAIPVIVILRRQLCLLSTLVFCCWYDTRVTSVRSFEFNEWILCTNTGTIIIQQTTAIKRVCIPIQNILLHHCNIVTFSLRQQKKIAHQHKIEKERKVNHIVKSCSPVAWKCHFASASNWLHFYFITVSFAYAWLTVRLIVKL